MSEIECFSEVGRDEREGDGAKGRMMQSLSAPEVATKILLEIVTGMLAEVTDDCFTMVDVFVCQAN